MRSLYMLGKRTVSPRNTSTIGNLLGASRAEADSHMLEQAFLETSDFRALQTTNHYSFVVGRRGTGKTAVFLQLMKEYNADTKIFCHSVKPEEHEALSLLSFFNRMGLNSYSTIRPAARVLWTTAILISAANDLCDHWKFRTTTEARWLRDYVKERRSLLSHNELRRCIDLLNQSSDSVSYPEEIPGVIATAHQLNTLESKVRDGLKALGLKAIFLFDGLDEGWTPDHRSTAVLGGLATAVAGFIDKNIPIQGKTLYPGQHLSLVSCIGQ